MTNMMQIDTAWKEDVTNIYKHIKAFVIELLQMNWALFLNTLTGGSFYPWICATRFFRVSWMLKVLSHDRNVVPNLSRKCDSRSQRGDFDTSASIVPNQYSLFHFPPLKKIAISTLIFPPFWGNIPKLCAILLENLRLHSKGNPFAGRVFFFVWCSVLWIMAMETSSSELKIPKSPVVILMIGI